MTPLDILLDDRYTVPSVGTASAGVAWLRANVARFSEGEAHRRRRAICERLLAGVEPSTLGRGGDHVAALAAALGLPRSVASSVRTVAACYQPHTEATAAGDAAVAQLVAACGGSWDEATANRIGLLVQACDATASLIAGVSPPVPGTRRIDPDGAEVIVPLDDHPFGAGRHRCPGEAHARALAAGAHAFRRLHDGPAPLVLPNAWDVASAALFARAGFAAVGTTSLGVAAAAGVPDAAGQSRAETLALASRLVRLPVPVTVDIESGWTDDPGELAELAVQLWELGVAGVNVEDGRGRGLAEPDEHAARVAALKRGAPHLFVNARTDTYWLGVDRDSTLDRAARAVDAGADGVFVPGIRDEAVIAGLTAALDVPLNVLAGIDVARLGELGVRRVSTGSAPYRSALAAALETVTAVAAGRALPPSLDYATVDSLAADLTPRHPAAD